jgi:hypothetical protein
MALVISPVLVLGQDTPLTPPAKRKFKYNGKIETTYDKVKDRSLVFFKIIPIKALEEPKGPYEVQFSEERLEITSYFGYPGEVLITPQWVTLAFWSATENPQKYTDNKLSVKVDGQWVELGTMKILNTTNYARRGKYPLIQESRELPIPYQQFLRLANAKKIKVKLGSEEFDLEKEHLEAIRDLAAHTVP